MSFSLSAEDTLTPCAFLHFRSAFLELEIEPFFDQLPVTFLVKTKKLCRPVRNALLAFFERLQNIHPQNAPPEIGGVELMPDDDFIKTLQLV